MRWVCSPGGSVTRATRTNLVCHSPEPTSAACLLSCLRTASRVLPCWFRSVFGVFVYTVREQFMNRCSVSFTVRL